MEQNSRVCGSTIDTYFILTGRDKQQNLSTEEKEKLVQNRIKQLDKTEWQRWTPLLGMYRLITDIVRNDSLLLTEMRSANYTCLNIVYRSEEHTSELQS